MRPHNKPDFSHIRTHVFRGNKINIEWKRPPRDKATPKYKLIHADFDLTRRRMRIGPDKDTFELFFTILHEIQHACFPDLIEKAVEDWEACAQRFARRMGVQISFKPKKSGKKRVYKQKKLR